MSIKVRVDNQVINFPEDMSQDEIKQVLREKFPKQQNEKQVTFNEQPKSKIKQKIKKVAKWAPMATIPFGPLISAPVTGVSRTVEGVAGGESIPTALKQGVKAGVFDAATFGLGKLNKLRKVAKIARKSRKSKGISQVAYDTAEDVLEKNKLLFSGKKRIPTKSLEDPRYVNEVGDATSKTIDTLKKTIMSKQKRAVADGKLTDALPEKIYKDLGDINLNPNVNNKGMYQEILNDLVDPDLTVSKLYDIRKTKLDKAINWKDSKLEQEPYKILRKKVDKILKDPNYNTKAKEYTKETRNLQVLLESKAVQNLVKKADPAIGTGKLGEAIVSSGPSTQRNFKRAINNLRVDTPVEKALKADILEGVNSLQVSKAFKDVKVNPLISKLPYIGDVMSKGYKRTLPKQQQLGPMVPRALSKILAGSSVATPIQRDKSGQYNSQSMDQIREERGL